MKKTTGKKATKRGRTRVKKRGKEKLGDLEVIQLVIDAGVEQAGKKKLTARAADVLKAIELKQKVAPAAEGEKVFWQLIDQLRREELSKN